MAFSFKRLSTVSLWVIGSVLVGGVSATLGVLAVVYSLVYFGDDSQLQKSAVIARIQEETRIYMLDEETQIGAIFANAHRRYVPIDEVPAHMINALVAAEDKNFYNHHGVDPTALFAAGVGYMRGGRMRGASTLTQQTVRNILGWWDVTLSRKFREWIAAMQLERLYSKRQILEFYLNQFYVSGNGNGIGIAAKYYFNKDVRDLDLVEAAFIAGSVKGPSAYDPFIKFTKERRERATRNAYHRKNYVLRRMFEQGWITEEQFKAAWDQPVKFNRGRFRSEEVALVHLVRSELEKPEVLEALGIEDPRELAAAGLKIFTTIDGDLQRAGQQAVRRNLSRLETILKGFKPEKEDMVKKQRSLIVNDFYYGQVTEIAGTEKEPEVRLSFGLPSGTIPYESLMRYAKIMDLPWGKTWQAQLKTLMKEIKVGDVLYVEIKEYDAEKHESVLELHKRPRVNGGMIAIDKGEVRAVVSGFDTKGFNRAVAAKRQPGSVFKPVVYFAALQLGWSILDRLDNERQVFPYQGRFYYPRADHDTPYKETSMLWAGIMSENLASVSLATRLVDKLNLEQFKQLMGVMDLAPMGGESARDFHYRVARAIGVTLDNDGVKEFQLQNAINDLVLDLQYTTTLEFQQKLRKMWWGRGYAAEMQTIYSVEDDTTAAQKAIKMKLAGNNFARLGLLDAQLVEDWQHVAQAAQAKGPDEAWADADVQHRLARFRVLPGLSKPVLGYVAQFETERPSRVTSKMTEIDKLTAPAGRPVNQLDMQAIWGGSMFGGADVSLADVQLDGWLPHGHFTQLAQYVEQRYNEIMSRQDDYDLVRYWQHHDFRIGIGLKYLVQVAKAMGVTSKIEPVQSFPLGTNDVTLGEVAKIYQTFISGKTYKFYEQGPPNQLNFLRRIEDRYGNVLFEPKRQEHQLVSPEFGLQMREVLRRIVTHGTGRTAHAELYLSYGGDPAKPGSEKRVRVPAFGKTGTTNDYTNANFAGFIPYPVEKGAPLDPENSYVIAAYVGYDLSKKMQAGFLNISGGLGALPAWVGLGKEILDKKKYVEQLDALDLNVVAQQEWPLKQDQRAVGVRVDMPRGVVMDRGGAGTDQETMAMANSAREGESRFDEFRANVVQSTIRVPLEGSGQALRMFSPFKLGDKDKKGLSNESAPSAAVDVSQAASAAVRPAQAGMGGTGVIDRAMGATAGTGGPRPAPQATPPAGNGDGDGDTPAAGSEPAPAPVAPADADDEALEGSYDDPKPDAAGAAAPAAPARPGRPAVDPSAIFDDLGNPDADEPAPNKDGIVEEELW